MNKCKNAYVSGASIDRKERKLIMWRAGSSQQSNVKTIRLIRIPSSISPVCVCVCLCRVVWVWLWARERTSFIAFSGLSWIELRRMGFWRAKCVLCVCACACVTNKRYLFVPDVKKAFDVWCWMRETNSSNALHESECIDYPICTISIIIAWRWHADKLRTHTNFHRLIFMDSPFLSSLCANNHRQRCCCWIEFIRIRLDECEIGGLKLKYLFFFRVHFIAYIWQDVWDECMQTNERHYVYIMSILYVSCRHFILLFDKNVSWG